MSNATNWQTLLSASWVTLLGASEEGLLVFDASKVCRMAGRALGQQFGVEPAALVGKPWREVLTMLSRACEEPADFLSAAAGDEVADSTRLIGDIEIRNPRRLVTWTARPVEDEGKTIGRIVTVSDVTHERNAERTRRHLVARIEQLTPIDALTGLANRRRFTEEHEREHGRAMRAWDSYGVLLMDVDGMRDINEVFGTPVGDAVLERVADLARLGRREYDVVARLENDLFAILLPGADAVAVRTVAQRLRALLAEDDGQTGAAQVTVSMGGAICSPPTGETAADIIRRCREALEVARSRGSGEVEIDADKQADEPEQV